MKNKIFSQKGFSLVEVLIVLLIFTVVALAILRAYVSVVHVAGDSSAGAKSDSGVMFGLATADKILQGSGFGANSDTTSSYGKTLAIYNDAGNMVSTTGVSVGKASDPNRSGGSLVWKSDTSTCQALTLSNKDNPIDTSSNVTTHTYNGLFYYADYSCTSGLALPTASTVGTTTIIIAPNDIKPTIESLKVITATNCNPYNITNTLTNGGAYAVILTANVYAGTTTGTTSTAPTQNTVNNQTCLFNFR